MTLKLKTPPMPEPDRAKAAINCAHCIDEGRLSLYFDPTKPGHNVLNQLGNRLAEVESNQLAARDAQWLELVGPVVEALKEAQQSLQTIAKNAGKRFDSDGQDNLLQHHEQVRGYAISRSTAADAALRAITEEQE